jgi:hypothetical protein
MKMASDMRLYNVVIQPQNTQIGGFEVVILLTANSKCFGIMTTIFFTSPAYANDRMMIMLLLLFRAPRTLLNHKS